MKYENVSTALRQRRMELHRSLCLTPKGSDVGSDHG